jgi:hypothetical protein
MTTAVEISMLSLSMRSLHRCRVLTTGMAAFT